MKRERGRGWEGHVGGDGEGGSQSQGFEVERMRTSKMFMSYYMIKINEPQLPWLRTAIYHTHEA